MGRPPANRQRNAIPVIDPSTPPVPPVDDPDIDLDDFNDDDPGVDTEALIQDAVDRAVAAKINELNDKFDEAVAERIAEIQEAAEASRKSDVELAIAQQAAMVANPTSNPLTPVAGSIVESIGMPEVRRRTTSPHKKTGTITEVYEADSAGPRVAVMERPVVVDEDAD
jgi:hypothetical protein